MDAVDDAVRHREISLVADTHSFKGTRSDQSFSD